MPFCGLCTARAVWAAAGYVASGVNRNHTQCHMQRTQLPHDRPLLTGAQPPALCLSCMQDNNDEAYAQTLDDAFNGRRRLRSSSRSKGAAAQEEPAVRRSRTERYSHKATEPAVCAAVEDGEGKGGERARCQAHSQRSQRSQRSSTASRQPVSCTACAHKRIVRAHGGNTSLCPCLTARMTRR